MQPTETGTCRLSGASLASKSARLMEQPVAHWRAETPPGPARHFDVSPRRSARRMLEPLEAPKWAVDTLAQRAQQVPLKINQPPARAN